MPQLEAQILSVAFSAIVSLFPLCVRRPIVDVGVRHGFPSCEPNRIDNFNRMGDHVSLPGTWFTLSLSQCGNGIAIKAGVGQNESDPEKDPRGG